MSDQKKYLLSEQHLAKLLFSVFIVLAFNGFISLLWSGLSVILQWTYLLHTLLGLVASAILLPYLLIHFQRTLGVRRSGLSFSGILSALLILALAVSGLHLVVEGQTEARRWVFRTHNALAFMVLVLLAIHIASHSLWLPAKRKKTEATRFPSLTQGLIKATLSLFSISLFLVLLASLLYQARSNPFDDTAVIKPYNYTYGNHPFRPSQTETSTGGFMDVKRVAGSELCASCHTEIAKQWQSSIHSQAASDKSYQTNINLLAERKGMEATRYCEGCHAPVALLSGQLTKGGKLDTPGHLQEGVSCMSCHGIERVEHLQGVASFRFKPPEPYLFAGSSQTFAIFIHNLLIRIKPEQHRKDLAGDVLANPELCAACHVQFMDKDFNGWGWVKMQDDYNSWLNSPYSGQTRQNFAHDKQQRCQDCHFPLAKGKDPSANSNGEIKTHFNIGANTAIPWFTNNLEQLQRTSQFLRTDKIRLDIDKPNRKDATESSRHINPGLVKSTESPAYCYLGEQLSVKIIVSNTEVGHAFPGGTTDINESWIHFLVEDEQGRKIYESGYLKADNNVEPNAYFYKTVPIDRLGNEVWRHDLFNMVGDSFKRTIAPGGTDVSTYSFTVPDDTKGSLIISASLNYRKFNNRYARWALKDNTIQLPIVEVASSSLVLPVRIRAEIAEPTK